MIVGYCWHVVAGIVAGMLWHSGRHDYTAVSETGNGRSMKLSPSAPPSGLHLADLECYLWRDRSKEVRGWCWIHGCGHPAPGMMGFDGENPWLSVNELMLQP